MEIKNTTILTIVLFCLSFVPLLWFPGKSILLGYDNVYPLDPVPFLYDRIFSWTQSQNFGLDQSGIQGSLIIHLIDSLPLFFGASPQLAQKIVFSFWFFLLLLSGYLLIAKLEKFNLIKTPYSRYIFPVLCAFNFYILQAWWIAERTKFSVIVATLLILSILLPFIKKPFTKTAIIVDSFLAALFLTVFNGGGWEGISLYGGFFVIFGCFTIFFLIHALSIQEKKKILSLIFFIFFFGSWYIFLNLYTLLPFALTTLKNYDALYKSAGGIEGLIDWTKYLSENASVLNLLRLQGIPDLYNNPGHPYAPYYLNKSTFIIASYVFPIFLFLSFLKKRKEHSLIFIFFLLVLIISFSLTMGTHRPFGFLFQKLMNTVPGFVIFRSAIFKFGYAYWISASFFIAIFLSEIIETICKRVKRPMSAYRIGIVLTILVIGLISFYYFPYFKGNFFRIDQSGVSSRIEVPGYVSDFSKWWKKNGGNERILLLPKLNDNWLYEQYRWGYLSLFPLLKNFGNTGMVENTDLLSPDEHILVNKLYKAINNGDIHEQELLTSLLGIRYFLVRNDFYHDLQNQETDDPRNIQDKLAQNPGIEKVTHFGKWSLYKDREQKVLVYGTTDATAFYGKNLDISYDVNKDFLLLDNDNFTMYPKNFSHTIIWPVCLSCQAERKEIEIVVPVPQILIDSEFYGLIQLRDLLKQSDKLGFEENIFQTVGEGLRDVGQVNELVLRGAEEKFINRAAQELISILDKLYNTVPKIRKDSPNPYVNAVTLDQYLQVYDKHMNELTGRTSLKGVLITIQKIQFAIDRVRNSVRERYDIDNFRLKKIYLASITSPGEYMIRIRRDSLGHILEKSQLELGITVDEKKISFVPSLEEEYIYFGKIALGEGLHIISLDMPLQNNLINSTSSQNIVGKSCFSSIVDDFNRENSYELEFISKNISGNYITLFIDRGESSFNPIFTRYFPPGLGQSFENRIVVSSEKMMLDSGTKLRIGFCSPNFTEPLYKEIIKDLSLRILAEPEITLYKEEAKIASKNPTITYSKINPTHYRISVSNAKEPFFLNLKQRFSEGWKASSGIHLRSKSNKYGNAWFIDKKDNFVLDIRYIPQSFSSIGIGISFLTLVAGLFAVYVSKKRKEHEKN